MTIRFSQIPATRRIPLYLAEFTSAPSDVVADEVEPAVILGQKLTSAPAVVGQLYRVFTTSEAIGLAGAGSPVALMARAFFAQNPTGRLYIACQTDADAATAASRTLTITGPATASGTLYLYVGGVLVPVGVTSGDAATAVATAIVTAVTANTDLPVSAAVGSGGSEHIVTFTAKVEGTVGNQITIAINPLGQVGGEELPTGIGVTLAGSTTLANGGLMSLLASGATDPTAASWGTSLGDVAFDQIAFQSSDATAVDALRTTLNTRWGATSAKDGVLVVTKGDTAANLITYATGRNDEHVSAAGFKTAVGWLSPAFEISAAIAGVYALRAGNDPTGNMQMTPLIGICGHGLNFTDTERDAIAYDGGATLVAKDGIVYLECETTTRRKDVNSARTEDFAYVQSSFLYSRIRRGIAAATKTTYPDYKLKDDDATIASGQRILTPAIYKSFLARLGKIFEDRGWIEDIEKWKESLLVERDGTNPSRLNSYCAPDPVNQARVFAMSIGTRS